MGITIITPLLFMHHAVQLVLAIIGLVVLVVLEELLHQQ